MSTLPCCRWCWGPVSPALALLSLELHARYWLLNHDLHSLCSPDVGLAHPPDSTCWVYASHGGHNQKRVPTILLVILAGVLLSSGFVG